VSGIPKRLSVVSVGTHDVPALRAFYESLGWPCETPGGDEFAAFPLGGAVLGLYRSDLLAAEAGGRPAPEKGAYRGVTLAINVEEIEMVDQVLETASAAGATILAAAETRDWGGRSGYFADPEGNAWEVAYIPGAEFDERGALIWPFGND
jgi:catechol 2,3-dioxygenase-like lactoylglutathione lyase family enzyme